MTKHMVPIDYLELGMIALDFISNEFPKGEKL